MPVGTCPATHLIDLVLLLLAEAERGLQNFSSVCGYVCAYILYMCMCM